VVAYWSERGARGYLFGAIVPLIPLLSLLTTHIIVVITISVLSFVLGLASYVYITLAWYGLGKEKDNDHMKLLGILVAGSLFISIFGLGLTSYAAISSFGFYSVSSGLPTSYYWAVALYLVIILIIGWTINSKVEGGLSKKIALGLLILSGVGSVATSISPDPYFWISIIGAGGIFILTLLLELYGIFSAWKMFNRESFKFGGILKSFAVIFSLVPLSWIWGGGGETIYNAVSLAAIASSIAGNFLIAIGFFRVEKEIVWEKGTQPSIIPGTGNGIPPIG